MINSQQIPIFHRLPEPPLSGKEVAKKFTARYKLEIIHASSLSGFVIGIMAYLTFGSHESIQYAGIYIIPWAYPIIGLCMFYFKMYIMSKRLVKMKRVDRKDPQYLLNLGSNAFSASVFLFADLVTLTATMMSFYAIGFGPETDGWHRLHTIEPAISCGIIPVFAMLSSCSLDTE